jgi:hypothetical protein
VPLLLIVSGTDDVSERRFDAVPLIEFSGDLRFELSLSSGQLLGGGEPLVLCASADRVGTSFSIGQPAFEDRSSLRRLGELCREVGNKLRQAIDFRRSGRLTLTRAFDFSCRRAQLLVHHVPGGGGTRHPDFVLGLDPCQLIGCGPIPLLRLLERGRRMLDLLLEINACRTSNRARHDNRQVAMQ